MWQRSQIHILPFYPTHNPFLPKHTGTRKTTFPAPLAVRYGQMLAKEM
jgi:hypothetical protein